MLPSGARSLCVEKQAIKEVLLLISVFPSRHKAVLPPLCLALALWGQQDLLPVPGAAVKEGSPETCSKMASLNQVALLWLGSGGSSMLHMERTTVFGPLERANYWCSDALLTLANRRLSSSLAVVRPM